MLKTIFWSGLFAGLACVGVQAQTLTVTPSAQTVDVGDAVSVDLRISGLGDGAAPSVGVFDIDFTFDPSLLSFSTVSYGTGLDVLGLGSLQATTPGAGTVNLFELSFDTADDLNAFQSDSFTLATLTFNTLAFGASQLTLSLNAVGDADVGERIRVHCEPGAGAGAGAGDVRDDADRDGAARCCPAASKGSFRTVSSNASLAGDSQSVTSSAC